MPCSHNLQVKSVNGGVTMALGRHQADSGPDTSSAPASGVTAAGLHRSPQAKPLDVRARSLTISVGQCSIAPSTTSAVALSKDM